MNKEFIQALLRAIMGNANAQMQPNIGPWDTTVRREDSMPVDLARSPHPLDALPGMFKPYVYPLAPDIVEGRRTNEDYYDKLRERGTK